MPKPSHFDFFGRRHVFLGMAASVLFFRMRNMAGLAFWNPTGPENRRFER
jgi:hypothetical protein